ncbi:DUF6515 family protein [Desulfosediminicola sp.]|uniref:DUF6515 family protein n=1 Tax=Desulfosediminicola sp. TaxID=2886825 RepID=UPI003AF2CB7A
MPSGFAVVHYYCLDGLFYRHDPKGFIVAPAPIGAVVRTLPPATIRVHINGIQYYACSGIYYRKVDAGSVVVA